MVILFTCMLLHQHLNRWMLLIIAHLGLLRVLATELTTVFNEVHNKLHGETAHQKHGLNRQIHWLMKTNCWCFWLPVVWLTHLSHSNWCTGTLSMFLFCPLDLSAWGLKNTTTTKTRNACKVETAWEKSTFVVPTGVAIIKHNLYQEPSFCNTIVVMARLWLITLYGTSISLMLHLPW